MEKGSGPPTSTTDVNQGAAPPYPGPPYQAAPLPDGYYAAGAPPPAYPAGPYQQPPPGYPTTTQMYYSAGQTHHPVVIQQQPNVVVVGGVVGQYGGLPPPDHQALAWFACLCCFWPLGIAAIIKSNDVRSACARGDYAGARMASQSARTLSMVSIGLGVAMLVLYIVIMIVWLVPLLVMSHHY